MDLPRGYREMSTITPGERATVDQNLARAKQSVGALVNAQYEHQQFPHPDGPCRIPCSSLDVYEMIEELSLSDIRQILFMLVHDAATAHDSLHPTAEQQLKGNEGV